MTTTEFSNNFEVLWNSYITKNPFGDTTSLQKPSIDEYEKSVLLTQAQYSVLNQYLYAQENNDNALMQLDLSTLITVAKPTISTSLNIIKYDSSSLTYIMPNDVLYVLNEKIKDTNNKEYIIKPINYKEYDRLLLLPFSAPNKKQAWRLFQYNNLVNVVSELIPIKGITVSEYIIRYIKKPVPIILVDLSVQNLTIEGRNTISECQLPAILHYEILYKAIELAGVRVGITPQSNNKKTEE